MTQVAELAKKSRGKPRNNLSSFDASKIEAELFAIESETLGLEPSSKAKVNENSVVDNITDNSSDGGQDIEAGYQAKARPTNVVEFSPEGSELLHRLSRNADQETNASNVMISQKLKVAQKVTTTKRPAAVGQVPRSFGGSSRIDGLSVSKKAIAKPVNDNPANAGYKPLNITSVALGGLKKANEFNSFSLRSHKSSLHNQMENRSLFEKSLDNADINVAVYDHSNRVNNGVKRYTRIKRSQKMLGGVDQHNLGPGKAKKALGYRPIKFIMPVVVVLSVSAYMMYTNLPGINLRLAESRAGITVSQPSYSPDGFKLVGTPEAETGRVAMSFKNGDLSYSISQNVSDWDSTALLENKVLKETAEYSAYTDRGLTIYVYGSKAVWVNQGKVNEIDSSGAKLEVEDVVRIAGSM